MRYLALGYRGLDSSFLYIWNGVAYGFEYIELKHIPQAHLLSPVMNILIESCVKSPGLAHSPILRPGGRHLPFIS